MNDKQKPGMTKLRMACIGIVLVAICTFVYSLAYSGTQEVWGIGIFSFVFYGLPWMLLTILLVTLVFIGIGWALDWIRPSMRVRQWVMMTPWILASIFWLISGFEAAQPQARFRSMVMDPIPEGIRDIKVAGISSFLARRWLFEFKLDRSQIAAIVARRGLTNQESFNFSEAIRRDQFLKRVSWVTNVNCSSNALCYRRMESADFNGWTWLVVDTNTSTGWFLQGYQN